jgi:hypothetical protein
VQEFFKKPNKKPHQKKLVRLDEVRETNSK